MMSGDPLITAKDTLHILFFTWYIVQAPFRKVERTETMVGLRCRDYIGSVQCVLARGGQARMVTT